MNATLIKTNKVHCRWMPDVHFKEQNQYDFNDSTALHLIRISDFSLHLDALKSILSDSELMRAENYLLEKDSNRFITSRAILKTLLAKYISKNALDIEFSFETNLKPRVKNANVQIHFNVSHSGDLIIIAIGRKPLGIDIEFMDADFNFDQIQDVSFNAEELSHIYNSHNKTESFYLLWTRKEALLKATGKGIDNDIPEIPSLNGIHSVAEELIFSDQSWVVGSFGVGIDYIASMAYDASLEASEIPIYLAKPEILN